VAHLSLVSYCSSAAQIGGGIDAREIRFRALDIDSMDFLTFITAIHHQLGVDVDYPKLITLDGAARYLTAEFDPVKA
jgi:hypothetical protein